MELHMPNKHHQSRQHKFTKAKYKVTNWSEYTEALRRRGDITLWLTDEAITDWHPDKIPGKRGRPQEYSNFAIECCLVLRQVYKLPLRQTQGFLDSLIQLMALNIKAPDYSNISKRSVSLKLQKLICTIKSGSHIIVDSTGLKVFGKDEWHQKKHAVKARRTWRKLHLCVDEKHHIVACELTDNSVGDTSAIEGLLNQVDDFDIFMGDGAYDGDPTYKKILDKNPQATVVIPPRKNAVEESSGYKQRNTHTAAIKNLGRMAWQKLVNYGIRAHSELAMLRYKTIIGPKMKARQVPQQKTEANISARVLNSMTQLGMPKSVKVS